MRNLLFAVLALALAVIVAGLTAGNAADRHHEPGQNAESPAVSNTPHKSARHQRLSQQQILSLGCGPLTEKAAEAVLRTRRQEMCG
jgi:hypothetical protein